MFLALRDALLGLPTLCTVAATRAAWKRMPASDLPMAGSVFELGEFCLDVPAWAVLGQEHPQQVKDDRHRV